MSEVWIGLVGSVVTALFSLIGVYIANRKNAVLLQYRIDQVEKSIGELKEKQDKHNGWVEKVIRLEGRMDEAEHDIRDLKGRKGA